jgi:hypothetical protein
MQLAEFNENGRGLVIAERTHSAAAAGARTVERSGLLR